MVKHRIAKKLMWLHAGGFFILLIFGGVSFIVSRMNFQAVGLIKEEMEELFLVADLRLAVIRAIMPVNDYLIAGSDPEEKENFSSLANKADGLFQQFAALKLSREEERVHLRQAREKFDKVKSLAQAIFALEKPYGNHQAGALMEELDSLADATVLELDRFNVAALEEHGEAVEEVRKLSQRSTLTLIAATLLSLLGLVILNVIIPLLITRPITLLHEGAELIGKGDFSRRINIRTDDELEQLAGEFNRMAEYLEESYAQLETKVSQRTLELEDTSKELLLKKGQLEESNLEIDRERRALLNLAEDMEKANAELKAAQSQLVQAEKMTSLGRLVAGIAHELNNPISYINSNLSTLKQYVSVLTEIVDLYHQRSLLLEEGRMQESEAAGKKLDELKIKVDFSFILNDLPRLVQESQEGTKRIRDIVQNLRAFSHIDEAELKYADLNELMESTLNIIWNELKYKVDLFKDYGAIPQLLCYPQQLSQVFMNLLTNASQAIEERGIITIKTYEKDKSVFAEISDSGCGIPEEIKNKIFEPFFTTKGVGKGTGLGLSIVYGIIQKHKGEISVKSKVGEGTTFTIRLPQEGLA